MKLKPSRLLFWFAAAVPAVLVFAAPAAPTAQESALIHQYIDALLKLRRKPERLPADPPNPFVQVGGSGLMTEKDPAATAATSSPARPAPLTEEAAKAVNTTEMLARFASRLRITGIIRLKDQVHVIINDAPWKEGDFLVVERGARIVQLQVVRIQPGQLTLRLDDAELMLRF